MSPEPRARDPQPRFLSGACGFKRDDARTTCLMRPEDRTATRCGGLHSAAREGGPAVRWRASA